LSLRAESESDAAKQTAALAEFEALVSALRQRITSNENEIAESKSALESVRSEKASLEPELSLLRAQIAGESAKQTAALLESEATISTLQQ
jgi:predicted  nucleic acid-binding Zn-ribbon protein